MKMARPYAVLFAVVGVALVASAAHGADASLLFDAPQLDGITVDGTADDWSGRGLVVGIMTTPEGALRRPDDFDAAFRLAWDDRGLLLLVTVGDNAPVESEDINSLWQKDSIEAFVASEVGGPDYYQVVVAPGRTESHPDLRHKFYDFRKTEPKRDLSVEVARSVMDARYVVEVLFPWANLPSAPKEGDEIGFQLFVNDADVAGGRFQVQFYPLSTAHSSSRMHRIRLASTAGPNRFAKAKSGFSSSGRVQLELTGVAELTGAELTVKSGSETLATAVFEDRAGRAGATILLPEVSGVHTYETITFHAHDELIGALRKAYTDKARARTLLETPIRFERYVFSTATFPECDFESPGVAKGLLGDYTVTTTFYDKHFNEAASAETPGRYGAVVEITTAHGEPLHRFTTLFRQPNLDDDFGRFLSPGKASIILPEEYGIRPEVTEEYGNDLSGYLWNVFLDSLEQNSGSAALMAGLFEATPTGEPVRLNEGVYAKDRQWWVGLKRKLYGTEVVWPDKLVCPRPIDGPSAPILRQGTAEEAGMKPDAAEEIDAVLQEWAADSDEAFAACLVRDGVIFLYKAYGERDGNPMTVTTKSWMASITKLLSGTLMMMCVDQGLVDLDAPVDTYLPRFRGIEVETPLTVRHLYTHTNGFWGHWGDDQHDFEELIAEYYPFLDVGEEHLYNGAGYALGGKIIETVTGEAIPGFYVNHLFGPLGCGHTDVVDTSGGARSVPLDIAKIGQLLLNRGTYGDLRFFSEETFDKMMPRKLTPLLGPAGENIEWGIGMVWMEPKGLSKKAFGHGAASAATLLIDPDNKLVVVMTRNAAGSNFSKYNAKFIAAVADNLAVPATAETDV